MFAVHYRKILLTIALVLTVASLAIVAFLGLKPGIDFTGGSLTEVVYNEVPEKSALSEVVEKLGIGEFSIQEAVDETGRNGYLVRTQDLTEAERVLVSQAVTSIGKDGEITRFTTVGPVMGKELRDKALWAVAGVVLIIVLYVAFAFAGIGKPVSSWIYGSITILVLLFDVIVPMALVSILGHTSGIEADILFVMALLAILGLSVNNSIVIFDRVRENLVLNRIEKRTKKMEAGVVREEVEYTITKPFDEIVGESISQTMARSINTSLTVLLALFALYFVGGEVTKVFALTLIAGVIAGTYSAICTASPLLVVYAKWQEKKQAETQTKQ
ncbi:MAG: Protein-export membrane protein SecF [Parcubacteria bacterium OLB19]|nr:MAG: Protein-export membrane protein SecF [Parcubacteria bacterium OLB19]